MIDDYYEDPSPGTISSMEWKINNVSRGRLFVPPTIEETDEDDSEKTRSVGTPRYPPLGGSHPRTAYVSVQKVLDDLATTTEGRRTRKSISTSSTFARGKLRETSYKTTSLKTENGKDSLRPSMGKLNEESPMREEKTDLTRKKIVSLKSTFTLSTPTSKREERKDETQLSRIERADETKDRIGSKKSKNNLSSILKNLSLELHFKAKSRSSKSDEIISRNAVPERENFLLRERTFLTDVKPSKRKLFKVKGHSFK